MTLHYTNNCQIFYNNIFSIQWKLSRAQNLTAYLYIVLRYLNISHSRTTPSLPHLLLTFSFKSIIIECHDILFYVVFLFFCWDFFSLYLIWCFIPKFHCCTNSLHTHTHKIFFFLITTLLKSLPKLMIWKLIFDAFFFCFLWSITELIIHLK